MKVKRRTPTGRIAMHARKNRPAQAKCANCKSPLHGMPRLVPSEMRKLSASERNPSRAYGGNLCSNCSRELFREAARRM